MSLIRLAHCPALLLAAFSAAGCAVTPIASIAEFAARSGDNSFEILNRSALEQETLVLDLSFDQQHRRAACGAHALASLIRYWRKEDAQTGEALWIESPPENRAAGYTMAELLALGRAHGLVGFGVRLDESAVIAELEKGRPVLVPVRVPSIYLQSYSLFDPDPVVIAELKGLILDRIAAASELTGVELISHYLLVIGYAPDKFVVLDPLLGFRTISHKRLAAYRKPSDNAALVFGLPNN